MTNEIRLLSIELENYRQYYGKHKIQFSSRSEGFTIISGKNGEGKSNLLNAISWCLYHEEPHGMGNKPTSHNPDNRSLSVMNNRYVTELNKEVIGKTIVKVLIKIGDDTYSISRILEILKHRLEYKDLDGGGRVLLITEHANDKIPKGCEIVNENKNDFVIMKQGKDDLDFHDTLRDGDPYVMMNQILPRGLSRYFLLDGDFLEGFWKDIDTIKEGIGQISQLNLLESLKDHVDKIRIPPKGIGKDTDELTAKLNNMIRYKKSLDDDGNEKFSEMERWKLDPNQPVEYYHATGEPRIKDLKADRKKMNDKITELLTTIHNISIPSLKLLQTNHETMLKQIKEEGDRLESLRNTYNYNLVTKSPYLFLKKAIDDSLEIIENRMDIGDLPIRQRRQFADDLLTKGTCICGENLDPSDSASITENRRKHIMNFKNNLTGKDDLDAAVDMRYDFKHEFKHEVSDGYNLFLQSSFGNPRKEFSKSEARYDDLNKKLKGITMQLKEYGNEKVTDLIRNHEYLQEQIQIITDKIHEIKNILSKNEKDIVNYRIQLNRGLKKNIKAKKILDDIKIWDSVYDHVIQVYDTLNENIRISVQNNTWNNFKDLLANPKEFKKFELESNYAVYLLDQHNFNKIRNLSAGQSLILTLAFVIALREPTGYKFPLVVDSPLGKIDGGNRYNIGKKLPGFIPNEQLTLLVIDTEYTQKLPPDPDYPDLPDTPFAKLLEESVQLKHFKIKKDKSGENTGNSSIMPAKLVFDDAKQGWMVDIYE